MPFPKGLEAVSTIILYGVTAIVSGGWAFLFGYWILRALRVPMGG
jgi:hypothetical protein